MIKTNYPGLNPVVVQALNNLQYRYSGETPEMWCSRVRYPFKKLLEYNPKYFSKNGFIQMIERSYIDGKFKVGRRTLYIYCTVCDSLVIIRENSIECGNDHLKKCITKTAKMHSNSVRKNVKKGGSVLSLSSDEIEKIYQTYSVMYSKGLNHYDPSHEGRKRNVNRLIDSVKAIQRAWRAFKLRPETWAKRVWEAVRNDGTPDDMKFLGSFPPRKYFGFGSNDIEIISEKEIQLRLRLINTAFIVTLKLLYQQGYIIVRDSIWGMEWADMLKWIKNPEYYHIDRKSNLKNFIRIPEYKKYMNKKRVDYIVYDSLTNNFKIHALTQLYNPITVDLSDWDNNSELVRRIFQISP